MESAIVNAEGNMDEIANLLFVINGCMNEPIAISMEAFADGRCIIYLMFRGNVFDKEDLNSLAECKAYLSALGAMAHAERRAFCLRPRRYLRDY
jgi:hypothetical protein